MSPSPKKLAAVLGIIAAGLVFTCVVFGGRDTELAAKGDDLDQALAAESLEKTNGPAAAPDESFELTSPAAKPATDASAKPAPAVDAAKEPAKAPAAKPAKKSAKKGVKAGKRVGKKHGKARGKRVGKKHGKARGKHVAKKHAKVRHKRAHA